MSYSQNEADLLRENTELKAQLAKGEEANRRLLRLATLTLSFAQFEGSGVIATFDDNGNKTCSKYWINHFVDTIREASGVTVYIRCLEYQRASATKRKQLMRDEKWKAEYEAELADQKQEATK